MLFYCRKKWTRIFSSISLFCIFLRIFNLPILTVLVIVFETPVIIHCHSVCFLKVTKLTFLARRIIIIIFLVQQEKNVLVSVLLKHHSLLFMMLKINTGIQTFEPFKYRYLMSSKYNTSLVLPWNVLLVHSSIKTEPLKRRHAWSSSKRVITIQWNTTCTTSKGTEKLYW